MIVDEYQGNFNDQNVNELKRLIELETWAYSKIDLSYVNLEKMLNSLRLILVPIIDLQAEILYDQVTFFYQGLLNYSLSDKNLEQMVMHRIENYLEHLYYICEETPNEVSIETASNQKARVRQNDLTDIYATDSSYLPFCLLDSKQYIKKVLDEHEYVLAFDIKCKKQLERQARLDIEQMVIMLLELKMSIDKEYKYFYLNEIYNRIFLNKLLEERVVHADFMFDHLFSQFSIQSSTRKANQNFLKCYREQISSLTIWDCLDYLMTFTDEDFTGGDIDSIYNLINFNISIEDLNCYIGMIHSDEIDVIKQICNDNYGEKIEKNECAKLVYSCVTDESYQQLEDFINFTPKEKEYSKKQKYDTMK